MARTLDGSTTARSGHRPVSGYTVTQVFTTHVLMIPELTRVDFTHARN